MAETMMGRQAPAPEGRALPSVLVFGGTSEGRDIAEWLSARGSCHIVVSSLTEYGGTLVEGLDHVESVTGAMLPDRMRTLVKERSFTCIVDATHPYATGVSASIAGCAQECGVPLVRVVREGLPEGPWTMAANMQEAASILAAREGNILLTTGSKDLPTYVAGIPDFAERLYARILPVASSVTSANELGIPTAHIIAMRGPFSKQLNCALIREFDIRTLVTKASGAAGGFWEKVNAAQECGIDIVVIDRPLEEEGMSVEGAVELLESEFGL